MHQREWALRSCQLNRWIMLTHQCSHAKEKQNAKRLDGQTYAIIHESKLKQIVNSDVSHFKHVKVTALMQI